MFWHRIDIAEHHVIRDKAPAGASQKKVRKQWTQTSYVKEYGRALCLDDLPPSARGVCQQESEAAWFGSVDGGRGLHQADEDD